MDDTTQDKPETAASTPSSQQAPPSGQKPSKDRNCPFCGQAFTSSSLGRHLDLYIKPKNSKPPDGVHDVAEIRKIRGGITRRQPKTSLRASSSNDNADRSNEGTPRAPSASRSQSKGEVPYHNGASAESPINVKDGDAVRSTLNAPNWQATGVINNLPPRASSRSNEAAPTGQAQRIKEMRRDITGNKVQRPDYDNESTWKLQEAAEVGRAAELALREVLSSLEAARKKTETKAPFEHVDFFSLSFPGLCLAILPPPSTLFTPIPFPSGDSWSLSPPGQKQYEALNRLMQQQFSKIRQIDPALATDPVIFKYNVHLSGAWEHWTCLTEDDQLSTWTLETLRSYSKVAEEKTQLRQQLEASQTRIRHLEAEYDRLSRCQLPREYLLHPPNTIPIPPAVLGEMQTSHDQSGAAEAGYDVDVLLNKWRAHAHATKRKPQTISTVTSPSIYNPEATHKPTNIREELVMNGSVWAVNGTLPRDSDGNWFRDTDGHKQYETPPNPGVIVDTEEAEAEGASDADADGDADVVGGANDSKDADRMKAQLALARHTPQIGSIDGVLNVNGKRPSAPGSAKGRSSGPKLYKAQWYNCDPNT